MNYQNQKPSELLFQFVETRLKDETYIFDDEEALIEYEVLLFRKAKTDRFGAPTEPEEEAGIYIDAVILIGADGQPTDEDILPILPEETLQDIRNEIASNLN